MIRGDNVKKRWWLFIVIILVIIALILIVYFNKAEKKAGGENIITEEVAFQILKYENISLDYPDNWSNSIMKSPAGIQIVSVQSPDTTFFNVVRYNEEHPLDAAAKEVGEEMLRHLNSESESYIMSKLKETNFQGNDAISSDFNNKNNNQIAGKQIVFSKNKKTYALFYMAVNEKGKANINHILNRITIN